MTALRPYQQEAVDAVFAYWANGGWSPLVELPTGAGKSLVLAALCRRLVDDYGTRVVVATHRQELIEQDERAIRSFWPQAPVGVFSAGLNRKNIDKITVGGIQSLVPHVKRERMAAPGVLLIDEAHLVSPEDGTGYRTFIAAMRAENPDMRLVGLTATPYRVGQGLLTEGENPLFSSIAYRVEVSKLVEDGYLSPLVNPAHKLVSIDVSSMRTHAGEYAKADLQQWCDMESVNRAVAKDVFESLAAGRTSALVFGVDLRHAQHLCSELEKVGVAAQVVTGDTSPLERAGALAAFKERRLSCICSCDVLTTGFDAPVTDVIALVRPTQSPGLYVQMVGRGMRKANGKSDCLLLDYGKNVERHGPITDVRAPNKRKNDDGPPSQGEAGGGKKLIKLCKSCEAENDMFAKACIECDATFSADSLRMTDAPSTLDPMGHGKKALDPMGHAKKVLPVSEVSCRVHQSRTSGKRTLRVDFLDENGLPVATEYVCLEHDGYARHKAVGWWSAFFPACQVPDTCAEAVEFWRAGLMAPVRAVTTVRDGKYTRVKSVEFDVAPPPAAPSLSEVLDEIPF